MCFGAIMSLKKQRIAKDAFESKSLVRRKRFTYVDDDDEWEVTSGKFRLNWKTQVKDVWIKIVSFLDIEDHLTFEQTFKYARLVGQDHLSWCHEIDMPKVYRGLSNAVLERFYKAPVRKAILLQNRGADDSVLRRVMTSWKDLTCLQMHPNLEMSQETGVECLKSWKRLQDFSFYNAGPNHMLTQEYYGQLGECKHLTSLDLGQFEGDMSYAQTMFQKWSSLKLKHFSWHIADDSVIDDDILLFICEWPLVSLILSGDTDVTVFEDGGFEMISEIKTLEKLALPNWTTEWDGTELKYFQEMEHLTYLSVQFVEAWDTQPLQHIGKMEHLTELRIEFKSMNTGFDDEFELNLTPDWFQAFPPRLEVLSLIGIDSWANFPENGWQKLNGMTQLELWDAQTHFIQLYSQFGKGSIFVIFNSIRHQVFLLRRMSFGSTDFG